MKTKNNLLAPLTAPLLAGLLLGAALPGQAQTGFSGSALNFNGVDSYVGAPLNAPTGPYTLECWVRDTGAPFASYRTIMEFGDDSPWLGVESGGVLTLYGVVSGGPGNIPIGVWTHVAYTWDGTTSRLFTNGIQCAASPVAPSTSGTGFGIGYHLGNPPDDAAWLGHIDEVRYWNVARSQAEIQQNRYRCLTGPEPGLMAYWRFDEGSGLTTTDFSGHGHHVTLVNGPTWSSTTFPGQSIGITCTEHIRQIFTNNATDTGLWTTNANLRITFHDFGTGATNYQLQTALEIRCPMIWLVDGMAELSDLGNGSFQYAVPAGGCDKRFFRVVGLGPQPVDSDGDGLSNAREALLGTNPNLADTDSDGFSDLCELLNGTNPLDPNSHPTIDSDGDGLSDAMEAMLGTNPNLSDTDDDGFSDGIEVASGTNPRSAMSSPPVSDLPAITFEQTVSTTVEGVGIYCLMVRASRPYSGLVTYVIMTNATTARFTGPGADVQPLSGTVYLNGTSGSIPIQINDDLEIRDTRLLTLHLKNDGTGRYRTGGASAHVVRIEDNDNYWSGGMRSITSYTDTNNATVLSPGFSDLQFRLKWLRSGSIHQLSLVSSSSTNATDPIKGAGAIPPGVWPLVATVTGTSLSAVSSAASLVPVAPLPLFCTSASDLGRRFTFSVTSTNTMRYAYCFLQNKVAGDFYDETVALNPSFAHLARTNSSGMFLMVKDPPLQPSPLRP